MPSPFKLEDQSEYKGRYSPHKIDSSTQAKMKTKKRAKEEFSPSPFKLEDETEYKKKYSPIKCDGNW